MIGRAVALVLLVLFGANHEAHRQKLIAMARKALAEEYFGPAYSLARQIIAISQTDTIGWLLLGLAQRGDGHPDDARVSFERAVKLAPDSDVIHFNLATACFESHRFADAEREYLKVASLDQSLAPLAYLNAGYAASGAHHYDTAERHLRTALKIAPVTDKDLQEKADDLLEEIQDGRDAEAHAGVRRLVHESTRALLSGESDLARSRLRDAIRLARKSGNDDLLEDLRDLAGTVDTHIEAVNSRLSLEASIGGGYDSDVVQSSVVIVEPTTPEKQHPGAAYLSADLALLWRALGGAHHNLTVKYNFSQTAYLSSVMDQFSIHEHDLGLVGRVSPAPWLSFEAAVSGFFLILGVANPQPFKIGAAFGPRVIIHEGSAFESRLAYDRTFKQALPVGLDYLSGAEDLFSFTESWRNDTWHLSLAYQFHRDSVGVEETEVNAIFNQDLDPLFGAGATYHIPYSYLGHQGSASATVELPWDLEATATLRYEHRDYTSISYILRGDTGTATNPRLRQDDRYIVEAALSRDLPHGFGLELEYTFIGNRSNIDFTNPSTSFDYDKKNYDKHLIELTATFTY